MRFNEAIESMRRERTDWNIVSISRREGETSVSLADAHGSIQVRGPGLTAIDVDASDWELATHRGGEPNLSSFMWAMGEMSKGARIRVEDWEPHQWYRRLSDGRIVDQDGEPVGGIPVFGKWECAEDVEDVFEESPVALGSRLPELTFFKQELAVLEGKLAALSDKQDANDERQDRRLDEMATKILRLELKEKKL